MKKTVKKPLAAAIGATFLASAALPAVAGSNPFTANPLGSGYDLVSKANAQTSKDGGAKPAEGKCGAGQMPQCDEKCKEMEKCTAEGKCGEGKCGDAAKCDHAKDKLEAAKPAPAAKDAGKSKPADQGKMSEGACGDM